MKLFAAGLNRQTIYQGSLASLTPTQFNQAYGANISVLYPVPITTNLNGLFSEVTTAKVDAITQPYIVNSYVIGATYATLQAAEEAKMLSFLQERLMFIYNDSDVSKTIEVKISDQSITGSYVEVSLFNPTYSELNGDLLGFVDANWFVVDECLINHDATTVTPTPAGIAKHISIPAGKYKPIVMRLFGAKDIAVPEDYVIITTETT